MTKLHLTVVALKVETASIRRIVVARPDGAELPGFEAGAHLTIDVPGCGARKYSLINTLADRAATSAPRAYTLGVRNEPSGGGGSRYMHALEVGDQVIVDAPQNNFPLKAGNGSVALIGGGIGITPLISMAATLKADGRAFRVTYAGRSRSELAFLPELMSLSSGVLDLHTDDTAGRMFDMAAHFKSLAEDSKVYMCGPKPMLKAGMDAAKALKWSRDRLAFELFYSVAAPTAPQPAPVDDGSFEVVLKSSGKSFRIPPDKTILDVLIAAGEDPINDCKRGECGVCNVGVIEGVPDHKDHILSESEKASGKTMQICISRAKTPKLVLDL